jgi:phospholipid/cholesterol/gamma-HCH transport system substrate-binding protein
MRLPWGHLTYEIAINVPQAPGVSTNTPVRKNGILIGRVKSIEDQGVGVTLHAQVDGNRPLYPEYVPHIRTSVLNDATIDFETHDPAPNSQPVPDGAVFQGVVDPSPFDSLADLAGLKEDFASAARSLGNAGEAWADLANQVNDTFGDEEQQGRVKRFFDTTERAMSQFATTMASVNEIIGDAPLDGPQVQQNQMPVQPQLPPDTQTPPGTRPPAGQQPGQAPTDGREMRQRLRQSLVDLPEAIREIRIAAHDFRVVMQSADRNFKNLEGFTELLDQKGDVITDSILKTVTGLDSLVQDLNALTRAVSNREGTIGRLIYDAHTYENFNRLMTNANQVLFQINDVVARLRPVVNDARVFMSKIATEPGRLVTGGLNPSVVK